MIGRPWSVARRSAQGWVLQGRKAYCSSAPALAQMVVYARIEGEASYGEFLVPRGEGVHIIDTWDTAGMRATESHDIELRIDPDAPEPAPHGQLTGLLAGLSAVTVPTLGVSIAGAGLINLIGNAVGGWVPALAGDTVDDEVRRRFHDQVEAGRILLVVDVEPELHAGVDTALRGHGATPMDSAAA